MLDKNVQHDLSAYLTVRRELIDQLPTLAPDTLKVFLVLIDRTIQQKGIKLGLSLNELARTADIGRVAARSALSWLSQESFITMTPKGKNHVITVSNHWIGDIPCPIPFTYDDTDQSKIGIAEAEIRRIDATYRTGILGESSGLSEILQGEERDIVREIEGRRGYGLSIRESYLMGKAIARYGPARFKSAWRQLQSSKDPIRAAYAVLTNGAKGKPAQQQESEPFRTVRYKNRDDD